MSSILRIHFNIIIPRTFLSLTHSNKIICISIFPKSRYTTFFVYFITNDVVALIIFYKANCLVVCVLSLDALNV